MVPAAVLSVLVQAKGVSQTVRSVRGVDVAGDKAARGLEKSSGRMTKALGAVGRVAKAGLFALGGAAALAGPKLIGLASDAEETAAKFKTVFGQQTPNAIRQLNQFSKATGTSRYALREQAAQFQALIRPMGMSTKAAGGMSIGMTKLATDLASFNNTSVEDAILALQSGLVGEAEPMRKYGVQLSAVRVQAYAYAKGIAKQGAELTAAQKAQASYGIILQDTKLAQGDAVRTSGSFANQFKRLKAQVTDTATELAIKLLPAATGAVSAITGFIGQMRSGEGAGGTFIKTLEGIGSTVAGVVGWVRSAVSWFRQHEDVTVALAAASGVLLTAWAGFAIASGITTAILLMRIAFLKLTVAMLSNPIVLVVAALAALAAGLVYAYRKSETFRKIVDGVWGWLRAATEKVFTAVSGLITGPLSEAFRWTRGAVRDVTAFLGDRWRNIETGVRTYFRLYKQLIIDPLRAAFEWVRTAVRDVRDWLAQRWADIKTAAGTGWGLIKTAILTPVAATWGTVRTGVRNVRDWLAERWTDIKTAAGTGWGNVRTAIIDPIKAAIARVKEIIGQGGKNKSGLIGWLSGAWDTLTRGASTFADNLKKKIVDAFKNAANKVLGFVNDIIGVINKIPGVEIAKVKGFAEGGKHQAQGMARGGAFARTGGVVRSPITLMGEEAPRHPEYVIPTNPAYRGRARGLLGQAAQAVGLAEGGVWSQSRIKALADAVGMPNPQLMSAIAMAESGGRPGVVGPPSGRGLWQVEWNVWADTMSRMGLTNAFNPLQNAKMADHILDVQGINAWVAYTNGTYKQFMDGGGGPLGAIGGLLKGALGLLADGGKTLIGKLPNPAEMLPDWLVGTGKWAIGKVTGWIKDKIKGLLGSSNGFRGQGALPEGTAGSVQKAIDLAMRMGAPHPSPGQLSGGAHAPGSLHYSGRAVDFGDAGRSINEMKALWFALVRTFGKSVNELFYDPMPWHIDAFQKRAGAFGGHGDHIHIGFAKGGMFGGLPFLGSYHTGGVAPREGLAHVARGEQMTPVGRANGPLVHIERMDVHETFDEDRLASRLAFMLEAA